MSTDKQHLRTYLLCHKSLGPIYAEFDLNKSELTIVQHMRSDMSTRAISLNAEGLQRLQRMINLEAEIPRKPTGMQLSTNTKD